MRRVGRLAEVHSHLRPRGTGRSSPELPRRPHRLQLHRAQLWLTPAGAIADDRVYPPRLPSEASSPPAIPDPTGAVRIPRRVEVPRRSAPAATQTYAHRAIVVESGRQPLPRRASSARVRRRHPTFRFSASTRPRPSARPPRRPGRTQARVRAPTLAPARDAQTSIHVRTSTPLRRATARSPHYNPYYTTAPTSSSGELHRLATPRHRGGDAADGGAARARLRGDARAEGVVAAAPTPALRLAAAPRTGRRVYRLLPCMSTCPLAAEPYRPAALLLLVAASSRRPTDVPRILIACDVAPHAARCTSPSTWPALRGELSRLCRLLSARGDGRHRIESFLAAPGTASRVSRPSAPCHRVGVPLEHVVVESDHPAADIVGDRIRALVLSRRRWPSPKRPCRAAAAALPERERGGGCVYARSDRRRRDSTSRCPSI